MTTLPGERKTEPFATRAPNSRTLPVNPLTLVTVKSTFPYVLSSRSKFGGELVILKSGSVVEVTLSCTWADWSTVPPRPLTMIVHAPTESEVELLTVIWTVAVGLVVVSVTLDWLNLTVKCCGSNWEERLTVP